MENYIVSARKYRPSTFNSVVGQDSITSTLKNAIRNNQLAQAFLFTGPRGVGKTTCARILAKTINCKNVSENIEPCNICESCLAFNASASFNVHELDAASNNSVEDIRSLVEQVRIPPQAVQYKVYIIDEVHMLSASAFNAFLKTLEEPPHYAKFILATTEKHKILPTILSRCQIFDFNRISVDDIAHHLEYIAKEENISAQEEGLHIIAQKADGSLRDALSIFDQISTYSNNNVTYDVVIENLNIVDLHTYFDITSKILNNDISGIFLLLNSIYDNGHDGRNFIIGLGDHFRNLLVSKDQATIQLLETTSAIKEKYLKQSQLCQQGFLIKALDIINKCDLNYRGSGNPKLLLELSLLQIGNLLVENEPIVQNKPKTTTEKAVAASPEIKKQTVVTPPVKNNEPKKEEQPVIGQGAISLSGAVKNEYPKDISKEDLEKVSEKEFQNTDFSEDDFLKAWGAFLDEYKDKLPSVVGFLTFVKPKKVELSTVQINLSCDFHKESFMKSKTDLVKFLREKLNVQTIEFDVQVVKGEEVKTSKPFTVKDKYQKMAEKNNSINTLINKLDLEFDY